MNRDCKQPRHDGKHASASGRAWQRRTAGGASFLCIFVAALRFGHAQESPQQQAGPQAEPLTLQVQELRQQATIIKPHPSTPVAPAASPSAPQLVARPAIQKRPAVVVLHPGFSGDNDTSTAIAHDFANRGFIVVMPSYRGEKRALDGEISDGQIEFCSGEVDDAQHAVAYLLSRADVDPFRIGLLGMSHGGCVALRTAIREPRVRAVVAISAPVAAEPVLNHLLTHPFGFFFYNGILANQIQHYIHGAPFTEPGSYAVRTPLFLAQKLTMPVFILHGANDHVVPVTQPCWLARVLKESGRTVTEQWFGKDGNGIPGRNRCALGPPAPPVAGNPPPRTELWLAEGQDHIFFSRAAKRSAEQRAVAFMVEELTR